MNAFEIWWLNFKYRLLLPVYWRGGGRIVAGDHAGTYLRVKLPFEYRTRGFFGTHAGGAMYAVVDPIYVFMLARLLGPEYMVWDKDARIEYIKAGTNDLYAEFRLSPEIMDDIKDQCAAKKKTLRHFEIHLADEDGTVHCSVQKSIYIRRTSERLRRRLV